MTETPFSRRLGALAFVLLIAGFVGSILVSSSIAPTAQRALLVGMLVGGAALEALQAALERRRPGLLASPAALAVCGGCAVSFLLGPKILDCLEQIVWWSALAVGGAALASSASDPGRRRGALAALLAALALASLHGLAQRAYLFDLLRDRPDATLAHLEAFTTSMRARSTFGQANGFAAFLVALIPAAAILTRGWVRIVFLGPALLALLATGSRGGSLVAVAVLAACAAVLGRRRLATALGLAASAGVAVVAFSIVAPERGLHFESLDLRFDYWSAAWRMGIDAMPFGVGADLFGVFALEHAAGGRWSAHPHQGALALFAETGVVGVSVLVFLVHRAFRRSAADGGKPLDGSHQAEPRSGSAPTSVGLLTAAAASAIAPAVHFLALDAPWARPASVAVTAAALVAFMTLARNRLVADPEAVRKAAVLGVAAFTAHALVDFDLYVPGALAAVVAVAATGHPVRPGATGPPAFGLVTAAVLAFAAAGWMLFAADIATRAGAATHGRGGTANPLQDRLDATIPRARALVAAGRIDEARALLTPYGDRIAAIVVADRRSR